jgi:ABC-type antimicrobial peptide transport system permease subunit
MFTVFGLLALVVAALGLYSVLAYDVALRRHELGVRAALGADVSRLVGMVFGRALRLVAAGTATGLALAVAASPWIEPLLFRVSPRSPWVYLAVAGVLLAAAALAGTVPAWRTTRIDPRRALEAE